MVQLCEGPDMVQLCEEPDLVQLCEGPDMVQLCEGPASNYVSAVGLLAWLNYKMQLVEFKKKHDLDELLKGSL